MPPSSVTKIAELYGIATHQKADWPAVCSAQRCPFLGRKCVKTRKSAPDVSIGTCSLVYGEHSEPVMICPARLTERSQIFTDCIHLLTLHEPGNELRVVTELTVPGGSIDYCIVSVRDGKARDFVGIELQTLDTTGTVWPERQRYLRGKGISVRTRDTASPKPFGMNWKMTAKTILVQLHHKISDFEHLGKHLVLVMQDVLLSYMRREFDFGHIEGVRAGDPMHFHPYKLTPGADAYHLKLGERVSTDADGIAKCLGRQLSGKIELDLILRQIDAKLSKSTPLNIEGTTPPVPPSVGPDKSE